MLVYPMYDYFRLELTKGGVDTSFGCIKGTLIFLISYVAFYIAYVSKSENGFKNKSKFFKKIDDVPDKRIYKILLFVWFISLAGTVAGQVSRGFSLNYILSLGNAINNEQYISLSSSGLLFLLMLNPTVIVSALGINIYGNNKVVKLFVVLITFLALFMRGSRMLMIVMLTSFAVYYYVKNNKGPSFKSVIATFLITLFIAAIMQIARTGIYAGKGFTEDLSDKILSIETYMAPFESDFSTYKVYYGIIEAIPDKMDYLYGKGIFGYTVALIIPRALWPEKPDAPEREVVLNAIGQDAVDAGNAYPNIGIFYSEFGLIGCIVFMFIYGRLLSLSRCLAMMNSKSALVLYSCLWPFCFQLTMRSVSNAVYSLFFGLLPFLCVYLLNRIFNISKR